MGAGARRGRPRRERRGRDRGLLAAPSTMGPGGPSGGLSTIHPQPPWAVQDGFRCGLKNVQVAWGGPRPSARHGDHEDSPVGGSGGVRAGRGRHLLGCAAAARAGFRSGRPGAAVPGPPGRGPGHGAAAGRHRLGVAAHPCGGGRRRGRRRGARGRRGPDPAGPAQAASRPGHLRAAPGRAHPGHGGQDRRAGGLRRLGQPRPALAPGQHRAVRRDPGRRPPAPPRRRGQRPGAAHRLERAHGPGAARTPDRLQPGGARGAADRAGGHARAGGLDLRRADAGPRGSATAAGAGPAAHRERRRGHAAHRVDQPAQQRHEVQPHPRAPGHQGGRAPGHPQGHLLGGGQRGGLPAQPGRQAVQDLPAPAPRRRLRGPRPGSGHRAPHHRAPRRTRVGPRRARQGRRAGLRAAHAPAQHHPPRGAP